MKYYVLLFTILNLMYLLYNIGYVMAFSRRITSGMMHVKFILFRSISYLIRQFLYMSDDVSAKFTLKVEHRNEYVTGRNFFIFRLINVNVLFILVFDFLIKNRNPFNTIILGIVLTGLFLLQYVIYHIVEVEEEPFKNIFITTIIIQYALFISYIFLQPKLIEFWGLNPLIEVYSVFLLVVSIMNYILITLITFKLLFQKNLFNGSKRLVINITSFLVIWITNILAGAILYDSILNISNQFITTITNGYNFLIAYYSVIREGFGSVLSLSSTAINFIEIILVIIPIPNLIVFFVLFGRLIDLIVNAEKRIKYKSKAVPYHKTAVEEYHETYFIN